MSWKTLVSKKKADFPLFKVFEDVVELPNGLKLDYYWVEKIPVVVVLPVISDKIVLVKQYRYPIKSISLELPAGHMKPNETPEECALRELKEETGFIAKKIEKLLSYHPSTEYSNQIYHMFIAKDLKDGETDRERYEIIDVEVMKTESVIEKIMDGTITDGRTIIAVLLAKFMNKF
ncbi:MAG: NUDIX hydrolase [Thermoplasmatales archaeon]|nr:NUDIX hydrolase [Thermoplasmatales archaeon]MCK5260596.1 NUDIX hydrolase [Thermoplasmatales archaeon]